MEYKGTPENAKDLPARSDYEVNKLTFNPKIPFRKKTLKKNVLISYK